MSLYCCVVFWLTLPGPLLSIATSTEIRARLCSKTTFYIDFLGDNFCKSIFLSKMQIPVIEIETIKTKKQRRAHTIIDG